MDGSSGGADTALVAVAAIGLIGFFLFWLVGVPMLKRSLNRNVIQRRAHREGTEIVSQHFDFKAKGTVEQVRSAVLSTVKVAPSVPAVIADAYIIEAADDHILYGYGNRLRSRNFTALLRFRAVDGGTHGSWDIVDWTLVDGVVAGVSVM